MGFVNRRTDLKNAPDVRKAAVAQNEANAVNETEQAVATKDVKTIRNDLAE